MKKLLLAIVLTGCSFNSDPGSLWRSVEGVKPEDGQKMVQAINALNDYAVKLDTRLKALEPKAKEEVKAEVKK